MADESTVTPGHEGNPNQEKTKLNLNTHKVLHATKSSPTFRSMEYLETQHLEFEGKRSRSSSAPMSVEAVTVARELRKASDVFVTSRHRGRTRKRRSTLGSILSPSIQKEVAQAIKECEEYPEQGSNSDLGTPV